MYFFYFTIYKEPEHEKVLDGALSKECREFFGVSEGEWGYFREKLEMGRVPGYSLTKIKNTDLPKAPRPRPMLRQHAYWEGINGEEISYWTPGRIVGLCGDCRLWVKGTRRRRDGTLFGICGKTGRETTRCTWCEASEEGEA